jgi:hypothetical protein
VTLKSAVHVTVERQRLLDVGKSPDGAVYRHWVTLMARVDALAKRKLSGEYVQVRTGNLRSSQRPPTVVMHGARIIGSAVNDASYAAAVHNGSKAHDVVARRKKVLTGWRYQGRTVFTPVSHIPAQRGRPWLRDALTEVLRSST